MVVLHAKVEEAYSTTFELEVEGAERAPSVHVERAESADGYNERMNGEDHVGMIRGE